jgi:hypothetical protein
VSPDLEAICEVLSDAQDFLEAYRELGGHPRAHHRQMIERCERALVTCRRLRDAAVEGWVGAHPASRYVALQQQWRTDRRCLLIPLADDPEKPDA